MIDAVRAREILLVDNEEDYSDFEDSDYDDDDEAGDIGLLRSASPRTVKE